MFSFSGPAEVNGRYQKIRDGLQPLLILIFVALPWVQVDHKPAVLLDFYNRHFVFFGFSFFSHDAPLFFLLVILLVLAIFTTTAVYGRLWCGWACPQTVFLHTLFNKVEKWVLGNFSRRRLLFEAESTLGKKIKIFQLYLVFLILSWLLAHSLVAYFFGAEVVTRYIFEGPAEHLQSFLVLTGMTAALFFNFTFFREKLCLYICPYGRFQNALIDSNTLVVFYNELRGEPRGKLKTDSDRGDCVDCKRCVTVCPVKIDIRKGFQQECIACGKCIDACNDVMHKIKRQPLLIRYETGDQKKISFARFRLILYGGLFAIFSVALVYALHSRGAVDFNLTRAAQTPFSLRIQGGVSVFQNQIQLHIKNQSEVVQKLQLTLSEKNLKDGYSLSSPAQILTLEPEADFKAPAFIEISEKDLSTASSAIQLVLKSTSASVIKPLTFIRVN